MRHKGELSLAKAYMPEYIESLKIRSKILRATGVAIGYGDIALPPGSLTILGGRTGHGKTSLAINIIKKVCIEDNQPAAYFSLQFGYNEVLNKLVNCMPGEDIDDKLPNLLEQETVKSSIEKIEAAPFYLDTSSVLSAESIVNKVSGIEKVSLIIVDHMELLQHRQNIKAFEGIANTLKQLAQKLDVAVLMFCNLPMVYVDKIEECRPCLNDFKNFGDLERYADIMGFIYRPKFSREDSKSLHVEGLLSICKNKFTRPVDIDLQFDAKRMLFQEIKPNQK